MSERLVETELYDPVRKLLEHQGYEVKAEVGAADVMAMRTGEDPVIVELKTAFSLALVHQAIERLKVSDRVYVAIPEWRGRTGWKAFVANRTLCRRLGVGIITVNPATGVATVQLDPGPYSPRKSKVRRERLLSEFETRIGDPNTGGSSKTKLVTAYRQDALRCLRLLGEKGPLKASIVATQTGVTRARNIMADNHYGWFAKVERGIYAITPAGAEAVTEYHAELEVL